MEVTQTLGAYYQCHKNAASFVRTILSFKKYYADNTVVVVNDGGYNYSEFCKDNGIKYRYLEKMSTISDALLFNSYESCLFFLKNLFDSFSFIKETHVLLLEDDVRVLKTHTKSFLHSINGCNKNTCLPSYAVNVLINKGYTGPFFYGGCGGCVLNKSFFQSIDFKEIERLIYEMRDETQMFASDILISFIAYYFGGTIEQYDEFAEEWYHDKQQRINNHSVAFLHQYKSDYERFGVFPNEEELKLLKNYI
jgi:hypothetical protein